MGQFFVRVFAFDEGVGQGLTQKGGVALAETVGGDLEVVERHAQFVRNLTHWAVETRWGERALQGLKDWQPPLGRRLLSKQGEDVLQQGNAPLPFENSVRAEVVFKRERLHAALGRLVIQRYDHPDGRVLEPEVFRDVVEIDNNSHFLALTRDGRVLAYGLNQSGQASVPKDLGKAVAIRARNDISAAQMEDGTWRAWGDDGRGVVSFINQLGPAIDLQFFHSGWVMWIEPVVRGGAAGPPSAAAPPHL